jgi:hypothetical protein
LATARGEIGVGHALFLFILERPARPVLVRPRRPGFYLL